MNRKLRILCYMDSPTCATGFGTVSRNILEALHKTGNYDIDVLGINYWGDPHNFPYRIWPVGNNPERDPYGRKKIANMIPRMDFDILFFMQDSFILDFLPELMPHLKQTIDRPFKSVVYFPIDGAPKENWVRNISFCDEVITYANFGKKLCQDVYPLVGDMSTMPHGVNTDEYKVLSESEVKEFRKNYFGKHADKFIFMNLNRNQQRKDIPRTIQAFAELRKTEPNTLLYLHMAKQDQGWNLPEVVKAHGFNISDDVVFPENFGPNQGYPREVVNMLYNCTDCVVSTCVGEGWGLGWIEAMAAKTPVIMPRNTAMEEVITDDVGYLVGSGSNPSLYTVLPNDNEVIRPLVDVEDLTATMKHILNNYDEAMTKADKAYTWVRNSFEWQGAVGTAWVGVFNRLAATVLSGISEVSTGPTDTTLNVETF